MKWSVLAVAASLSLVLSNYYPDFTDAMTYLAVWCAMGYLGWGWANYNAYSENPEADKNPKKWDMLPVMIVFGPLAPMMTLIIGLVDWNLKLGLRFK